LRWPWRARGRQPPPSITLAVAVYLYPTDTINGDNGNTIDGHRHITTAFTRVSVLADS